MSSRDPAPEPLDPELGTRAVPVFPLPDVVFFPRTVLPLHVFEPRYRVMVRDALAGERRIVVALLRPGWEADYLGNPDFFGVGTLGQMEDVEALPDGRFNFRLVGLRKVRLGRVVRSQPYRTVELSPVHEPGVDESDPSIRKAKLDLLASWASLLGEIDDSRSRPIILDDSIPFENAVNEAGASLPVEPAIRQQLLEQDDLIARHRLVSELVDRVLEHVIRLKAGTGPGDDPSQVH